MKKTRVISNNKKCLYCGKLYPSDTDQKRCTCELVSLEDTKRVVTMTYTELLWQRKARVKKKALTTGR